MPRKKKEKIEGISDKLEYLGLDLDKIPQNLKKFEPLEYRVTRTYDEKQYRQYRYIDIKDIQILLSPTNRLTDLNEKYKKARPLYEYLDNKNEENIMNFKYRKAYACNKSHPNFNCQFKSRIQKFYRETGVLLRSERIIKNIK